MPDAVTADKDDYEQAKKFVSLPRCATCEHCTGGKCEVFGQDIPTEYMCTPTECADYLPGVPF